MTLDLTKREVPVKTYRLTPDDAKVPERLSDVIERIQRDGLVQGMATQARNRLIESETTRVGQVAQSASQTAQESGARKIMVGRGLDLTTTGSKAVGTLSSGPWEITRVTVLVTALDGTVTTPPSFGLQCAGADVFASTPRRGTPEIGGKWRMNDAGGYSPPTDAGDAITLNVTVAAAGATTLTVDVYVFGHML